MKKLMQLRGRGAERPAVTVVRPKALKNDADDDGIQFVRAQSIGIGRREMLVGAVFGSVLNAMARGSQPAKPGGPQPSKPGGSQSGPPFVDLHAHPVTNAQTGAAPSLASILEAMGAHGITRTVLAPPPAEGEPKQFREVELSFVKQAPDRFAFAAGGEVLNGRLQHTPADGATPDVLDRFRAEATAIAESGAAAFAELGTEVLPSGRGMSGGHSHQTTPADHPLLLALTEIAARYSMPIAIHMEAITKGSEENISHFERLLSYNRQARIVWLHAGWDRTGQRTVELMKGLLGRHPNLFMTLKSDHNGEIPTAPLAGVNGRLKPEWLALFRSFPDRFAIGSDQFYDFHDYQRLDRVRQIINALPLELAQSIGIENPKHIYRLPN